MHSTSASVSPEQAIAYHGLRTTCLPPENQTSFELLKREDIPAQAAQLLGALSLPLQAVPYLSPITPRAGLAKYSNP